MLSLRRFLLSAECDEAFISDIDLPFGNDRGSGKKSTRRSTLPQEGFRLLLQTRLTLNVRCMEETTIWTTSGSFATCLKKGCGHREFRLRARLRLGNECDAEGFWTVVTKRGRRMTRTRGASLSMQSSKQSVEKSCDLPGEVALAKGSKEDFQSHLKVSAGFDPRLQSSSGCFQGISNESEGTQDLLFQLPSTKFQFPQCLEEEFRQDPEFRHRPINLERMLRARDSLVSCIQSPAVGFESLRSLDQPGDGKGKVREPHPDSRREQSLLSRGVLLCASPADCVGPTHAGVSAGLRLLPVGEADRAEVCDFLR